MIYTMNDVEKLEYLHGDDGIICDQCEAVGAARHIFENQFCCPQPSCNVPHSYLLSAKIIKGMMR